MPTRKIGPGFKVWCLALGAMGRGTLRNRDMLIATLCGAVECGVTLIETAEVHRPWLNEETLGEALEPLRDRVQIAKKIGWNIDQRSGKHPGGINSKPSQNRASVNGASYPEDIMAYPGR